MEIFNVNVFFENELPIRVIAQTFVGSWTNLKFIIFEINLNKNSDGLFFIVNHIDLFGDCMKLRKSSVFGPLVLLDV